jgi:hypothetical protein
LSTLLVSSSSSFLLLLSPVALNLGNKKCSALIGLFHCKQIGKGSFGIERNDQGVLITGGRVGGKLQDTRLTKQVPTTMRLRIYYLNAVCSSTIVHYTQYLYFYWASSKVISVVKMAVNVVSIHSHKVVASQTRVVTRPSPRPSPSGLSKGLKEGTTGSSKGYHQGSTELSQGCQRLSDESENWMVVTCCHLTSVYLAKTSTWRHYRFAKCCINSYVFHEGQPFDMTYVNIFYT